MPNIDLADYKGREQEFVKHSLLEEYLPQLGLKVGSAWDSLVYVDGFAGPWQSMRPDFSDSSFGVATKCLRNCREWLRRKGRDVRVVNLFVEKDGDAFEKLDGFAKTQDVPGFAVKAFHGAFADQVGALSWEIKRQAKRPFKFVFLDPMGWTDIPMAALQQLLSDRSCEVLINLMTKHITRFLGEQTRAASYQRLFGREGVLGDLQNEFGGNSERADLAVREYCRSLHQLCNFEYVSQAVILEPGKDEVRYFLVYATNHHRGVEVFKESEIAAANVQSWARHEVEVGKTKQELMIFDDAPSETAFAINLRSKYKRRARAKVIDSLLKSTDPHGILYAKLFCDAMAFPLVTPDDLTAWLTSFEPHAKLKLAGSDLRKKPKCDENDRIFVRNPVALEAVKEAPL
jgi:three-Cys-motif partner protein